MLHGCRAWPTPLGQWMYQDGAGAVYVSDDGKKWRAAVSAGMAR